MNRYFLIYPIKIKRVNVGSTCSVLIFTKTRRKHEINSEDQTQYDL